MKTRDYNLFHRIKDPIHFHHSCYTISILGIKYQGFHDSSIYEPKSLSPTNGHSHWIGPFYVIFTNKQIWSNTWVNKAWYLCLVVIELSSLAWNQLETLAMRNSSLIDDQSTSWSLTRMNSHLLNTRYRDTNLPFFFPFCYIRDSNMHTLTRPMSLTRWATAEGLILDASN